MARTQGANAEHTRLRILDSASQRFAELGAAGSSVRDIARGAGVSQAMVHHYFGSKDELYVACVDSMYSELNAMRFGLAAELQGAASVEELITQSVRVTFRFARERRTTIQLLMRRVVEQGELDAEHQQAMQLPFLEEMSLLLEQRTKQPASELRLSVQSVTFLISRYALSSEHELRLLTGLPRGPLKAVLLAVEIHLVRVALTLFGLELPAADGA